MNIYFDRLFMKQLKKLSPKLRTQTIDRIELFRNLPHHPALRNHKLNPPFADYRSINISGDIRAIYQEKDTMITFVKIGTHSELYS